MCATEDLYLNTLTSHERIIHANVVEHGGYPFAFGYLLGAIEGLGSTETADSLRHIAKILQHAVDNRKDGAL